MIRIPILIVAALLGSAVTASRAGPRSGYDDASPDTRAMQDDDAANPGFLWVRQGGALWTEPTGRSGKAVPTVMVTLPRACVASLPAIPPGSLISAGC